MIYQIFSTTVKPGKMPEARQHFLDLATNAKENNSDLIRSVQILSNIGGLLNQLRTLISFESLRDQEKMVERWKAQEHRAKSDEFFSERRKTMKVKTTVKAGGLPFVD